MKQKKMTKKDIEPMNKLTLRLIKALRDYTKLDKRFFGVI